ncbi:MAG: hypothetical protein COB49_12195 [Alphaproteobacteria bacterium]|nr:MAG: hypothetical protein COB49_12195 [Alphaproteobacteria bacterium]
MTSVPLFRRTEDGKLILKNIFIPGQSGAFHIMIQNGCIGSITPSGEALTAAPFLCLPPLADLHVHANRAFSVSAQIPRSFHHAIELTSGLFRHATVSDYESHSIKLFQRVMTCGTRKIRTHADIDVLTGLKAVEGTLDARRKVSGCLDVDVVAFVSGNMDPTRTDSKVMLRDAVMAGAAFLGGVPVLNPDPGAAIEALLDLAIELDVGLDIHLDEHLDPENIWSGFLADAVMDRNLEGKVWLSHGSAISVLPSDQKARVIDKIAQAEITVISLPATNLYLQDREYSGAPRRGLAPVKELAAAGVPVRLASDNIQDFFYPYGSGDLLDIAAMAATAAFFEDTLLLVSAICDGHTGIAVGDAADFILISGESLVEVIANRPRDRYCIQGDKVVNLGQDAVISVPHQNCF